MKAIKENLGPITYVAILLLSIICFAIFMSRDAHAYNGKFHSASECLTGGVGDSLDAMSVTNSDTKGHVLLTGDIATVTCPTTDLIYFYIYDSTSSAAEDPPGVIAPDDAGATGRWIRSDAYGVAEAILSHTGDASAHHVATVDTYVTNKDSHAHSVGDGAQIDHTTLSNIGSNSHSQIDTHLASTSNPHSVTGAQLSGSTLTIIDSVPFVSAGWTVDGNYCDHPNKVVFGGTGEPIYTVVCADSDLSWFSGSVPFPGWTGGNIDFVVEFIQTNTETFDIKYSLKCKATGLNETANSNWGDPESITVTEYGDSKTNRGTTTATCYCENTCEAGDRITYLLTIDSTGTDDSLDMTSLHFLSVTGNSGRTLTLP